MHFYRYKKKCRPMVVSERTNTFFSNLTPYQPPSQLHSCKCSQQWNHPRDCTKNLSASSLMGLGSCGIGKMHSRVWHLAVAAAKHVPYMSTPVLEHMEEAGKDNRLRAASDGKQQQQQISTGTLCFAVLYQVGSKKMTCFVWVCLLLS